eukprot:g2824.t1
MVKILQHIEEVGELLLLSIMIRYRPDEMKACKLDKNLTKQGYDLCEFTHLIHKTCTMQAGQTRTRKLHSQARRFCKMILQFQSDFNAWDEAQAFKMFNLIRHVITSGSLPFKVAPSAGLIRAVKEEKKIAAGSKNDPFDEGNDTDEEIDALGLNGKSSTDKKDDASSKSSWTGTVTESENSESSWASLQRRELRRAHHDNMAYRHSMATQITVNRKKTSISNYSFRVNRFNTNTKATFETTKMGQKEIYQKMMPRSNMIDDEGNVRPVSPRLAKDTREGYKIVREMQHKAKAESVSHRGRHTQKGHFQIIPFIPVRPETTKRPKTTNVTTRRNIVEPQPQEQQQRAIPNNADNKGNNSHHSRRPKTSMGNNNNNRKVRPQTAVGSYNIDNSSTTHNTYSIRSKSVIGNNTCLNMDTILKKARPQSSIATRHMVNVTGNYKAITTVAKNSSQNNKSNKCSTTTNLGSSSSAYFNDMNKFEKILDKKEKRDQIKKQMKSWKTKTKAHARKRKNQLIAEQMYKKGNSAEARKARSQNIKADRLRKFTPFSF